MASSKMHLENNLAFSFKILQIYWYDAISSINPFKRALESKLSNFKILAFFLTH